jgi:hypothetical protein
MYIWQLWQCLGPYISLMLLLLLLLLLPWLHNKYYVQIYTMTRSRLA